MESKPTVGYSPLGQQSASALFLQEQHLLLEQQKQEELLIAKHGVNVGVGGKKSSSASSASASKAEEDKKKIINGSRDAAILNGTLGNDQITLERAKQLEEVEAGKYASLSVKLMCPNCRNPVPNIIENFAAGDLVCNDCGLVLGSRIIDTRSEWRTFSNEEGDDPSRVGSAANALLDGPQLDTLIGRMDGGSGMAKNLNQIHSKTMQSKTSKNLIDAYKQISAMCDTIDLPKAIGDLAKHWFKKTQEQNLLRGKSSDVIIAACILMACKQEKVPRTFKEISALTKVPIKEIGRAAKALIALHDSSVSNTISTTNSGASSTLTTADSFIHRFCSNLNLKQIVQKYASDIVQRANELSTLSGKSPVTVAAAAIYMAAFLVDTPVTISDIKSATGAHETVTKAAYKALYQDRSRIFAAVVLKPGHSVDKLPQP